MKIEWLIGYLEELKAEGETDVFALVYDRNDATGYYYGYASDLQPNEISKEVWELATEELENLDFDLGDRVYQMVGLALNTKENDNE
jgi:hypothetical protein